jgi:hypothetical protein
VTPPETPLDRLHRDLGLRRLNPVWAKVEILLGLVAVAAGLFGGGRLAAREARTGIDEPVGAWAGQGVLVVLGGYLALAGHRSHLYQSNNRLAAHLADLARKSTTPSESPP